MKAYKGFDKDLKCEGFQYEVGKTYKMNKKDVKICSYGFHACLNPFDVLDYYPRGFYNRFCEVEVEGKIEETNFNSKVSCTKITIIKELSLKDFIKAMIGFAIAKNKEIYRPQIASRVDSGKIGSNKSCEQIASSVRHARITSGSEYSTIASIGDDSTIVSSGDSARIASSGTCTQIVSSDNWARIYSSGEYAKIALSGNASQVASSGDSARIALDGANAQISSSGYSSKLASSGEATTLSSSGKSAQIASSGAHLQVASSGKSSKIVSSGEYAEIASTGDDCVICCAGIKSKLKAKVGSWITLAEWEYSKEKNRYIPICVKTEYVDGVRVKGDMWYKLEDGEFVEV